MRELTEEEIDKVARGAPPQTGYGIEKTAVGTGYGNNSSGRQTANDNTPENVYHVGFGRATVWVIDRNQSLNDTRRAETSAQGSAGACLQAASVGAPSNASAATPQRLSAQRRVAAVMRVLRSHPESG